MHRQLIALLALFTSAAYAVPSCPITVGTLTLSVTSPRTSGISPLTVFLDATATTDSATLGGANTTFQDVGYLWNFSDTGVSGAGNWAYGAHTAYSSRNLATGGIAAHLYVVTPGSGDKTFTPIVSATDGTNTAVCSVSITVFDPSGANGFPGAATTCYFNSTVGSGCPAGATQTATAVFSQTNGTLSNKRLLYKCGDTFTGDSNVVSGSKVRIGAYGTCLQTKTNRPIFNDTATNYHINIARTVSDVAISDIDMESSGGTSGGAIGDGGGAVISNSQVTINNVKSAGNKAGFSTFSGTQTAFFDNEIVSGITQIAFFVNSGENNCVNGSTAFNCGGTPSYLNINYIAVIGNHINGIGSGGGGGVETLRISAWQWLVVSNNDIGNSNTVGSPMKIHSGNTFGTLPTWIGQYSQFGEFSDNYYYATGSGFGCQEIAPQNAGQDERIKLVVIERDLCAINSQAQGARLAGLSAQNLTLRDSVYLMNGNATFYPIVGPQFITRGNGNFPAWQSINNEAYNISCNVTTSPIQAGQECVGFDGLGGFTPVANSFAANNMIYTPGSAGHAAVSNTGTGNTVSNNTTNSSLNPAFKNAGGSFILMSDWKPTANFSGGKSVPVQTDALGVNWSPTWDLGAVKH